MRIPRTTAVLLPLFLLFAACKSGEGTVKVGLLHSLSGTMAISEAAVRDAELLAIAEINAAGGVLGKQIEAVEADGESNPDVFARKSRELLTAGGVSSVFGCWTSTSRQAVIPVFEELNGLLWYPVQYEGMERSRSVMYMGACPNQQIVPAVEYCAERFGTRFFLIGSDYVFPRTAHAIIKAQLASLGGECVGEVYEDMGMQDFTEVAAEIARTHPDVVMNTLNGDSNVAFFSALAAAGISAQDIPVMSFSIAEEEISRMDAKTLAGHLVARNYFETLRTQENEHFVSAYTKRFGKERRTSAPVEASYIAVHLWALACEKAGSFDTDAVRVAAKGLSFPAPEGLVTLDSGNQHLYKKVRIGTINAQGLIDEVWEAPSSVRPDPYLSTYAWALGL